MIGEIQFEQKVKDNPSFKKELSKLNKYMKSNKFSQIHPTDFAYQEFKRINKDMIKLHI